MIPALSIALGLAVPASAARRHDPRLDDADAAIEKAVALLEASSSGIISTKAQREFDRAVSRALTDLDNARQEIAAAGAAADGVAAAVR